MFIGGKSHLLIWMTCPKWLIKAFFSNNKKKLMYKRVKDHKKWESQVLFVVFLWRIRKCSINNDIYCQKRKTLYHIVWELFSLFFLCSVHNFATQKWLIYMHSIRTLSWSIKWKLFIQPVLLCKLYEVKVFYHETKRPFCFVDFVIYK